MASSCGDEKLKVRERDSLSLGFIFAETRRMNKKKYKLSLSLCAWARARAKEWERERNEEKTGPRSCIKHARSCSRSCTFLLLFGSLFHPLFLMNTRRACAPSTTTTTTTHNGFAISFSILSNFSRSRFKAPRNFFFPSFFFFFASFPFCQCKPVIFQKNKILNNRAHLLSAFCFFCLKDDMEIGASRK